MTFGVWPSIKATQELVVPRSIPIMVSPFLVEKDLTKQFLKMVLIIFVDKKDLFIINGLKLKFYNLTK